MSVYIPPAIRGPLYALFALVGVVLGAVQIAFAQTNASHPTWLLVSLAVYPFVGGAIGFTAASNTPSSPIVAADVSRAQSSTWVSQSVTDPLYVPVNEPYTTGPVGFPTPADPAQTQPVPVEVPAAQLPAVETVVGGNQPPAASDPAAPNFNPNA